MREENCILCDYTAQVDLITPPPEEILEYKCPNCGEFCITGKFKDIAEEVKKGIKPKRFLGVEGTHRKIPFHLLSGYVREMNDNGKDNILIRSDNWESILDSPLIPQTPMDKLDKLLIWYYKQTKYFGELIHLNINPSICYAYDTNELAKYYELIVDKYLLRIVKGGRLMSGNQQVYLSLEGHQICQNLIRQVNKSTNNAFVAMWFAEEMNLAYHEAIKPAIEGCGFHALRVDNHEHNNDITDEIISGIKNSRFVVADLTGYRAGVYYEAGFARGLDIPVILTCRKDWFEGEYGPDGIVIKEKVHFDVNHLNIIVWNNPQELKEKLVNRIKATIL